MRFTLTHRFHDTEITILVRRNRIWEYNGEPTIILTKHQLERVKTELCPHRQNGCSCGSTRWLIAKPTGFTKGREHEVRSEDELLYRID